MLSPLVHLASRLPVVAWVSALDRETTRADLAAGVTVAAMLIPQAMAYALLAGLPPEVGLYSATIPLFVYAVFGTSRQLAVGPVAISSLLTAAGLAPLVAQGTPEYLAAAALLAVMVGLIRIGLGLGRLGVLVNYLRHAVLVGFTAAAALIIGLSQVKHLFGVRTETAEGFVETIVAVGRRVPETEWTTVILSLACLLGLLALRRYAPQLPAALVVVIFSIGAVELFGLEARGVSVVGDIPRSLPHFLVPSASAGLVRDLADTALVIAVVGFMESIAVAKVYARRNEYAIDANAELIGLGAANVAAGFFGGYPVNGGLSRTAVNASAGARTQLASVVTASLVLVTIALFTPLLGSLPNAALAAIIVTAIVGLVDVTEIRRIARLEPTELVGLLVAFAATLLLGVERGIGAGVAVSLLVPILRRRTSGHSDQTFTDQTFTDQTFTDQTFTDEVSTDQILTERTPS